MEVEEGMGAGDGWSVALFVLVVDPRWITRIQCHSLLVWFIRKGFNALFH